jgi:saccharopine dehydrogenase (NAD+, L-lysine-forming)
MSLKIWLRDEDKIGEKRSPLSPLNAKELLDIGVSITVQSSKTRIFTDKEYKEVGCHITESSWHEASLDTYILGLKELNVDDQTSFSHRHIYFAHSYKGQEAADATLSSFKRGSGALYDLEYLVNDEGKRIAAFGVWAGFVGMALAIDYFYQQQISSQNYPPLSYFNNKQSLIDSILEKKSQAKTHPKIMIIGALGRCGHGASQAAAMSQVDTVAWDYQETKSGGPFTEINEYDIFINCALITKKIPPFVTIESLSTENKNLSVVADVGCDPQSELNPLPIYQEGTTWAKPFVSLETINIDLISIDNLPSILPLESSLDFSEQLVPYLIDLHNKGEDSSVWKNAFDVFQKHLNKS